jgi:hypothetical protein
MLRINNASLLDRSFEPLTSYHLARGLTISISDFKARLSGGRNCTLLYDIDSLGASNNIATQSAYQSVISTIEKLTTSRLMASSKSLISVVGDSNVSISQVDLPPDRLLFVTANQYLSDADLGEVLLTELNVVENVCRLLLTDGGKTESTFSPSYELALYWQEENNAGRLDPLKLTQLIASVDPMVKKAFFYMNIIEVAEGIRGSLLAACYHLTRLTELIWQANIQNSPSNSNTGEQHESIIMSPLVDRIADEYSSAVISAYTSLDILYEYFVFLTRQDFEDPRFPDNHHFPAQRPFQAFREGGSPRSDDFSRAILPLAIPNLSNDDFHHLRTLRNDLVHNMTPDWHRPFIYVGTALSAVGGLQLQYAQYLSRDIEINGAPKVHPWIRRFYTQQRDAQLTLYELIEQTWQCCFDTTRWISNRLVNVAKDRGLSKTTQ